MKAGSRSANEIKLFIDASYEKKPPSTINDWFLDKSISSSTATVYYNPNTGEAVVIHRGTQGATDWLNNASYLLGTYESTDRYKEGKKVQKKAEKKYGSQNISTIGHSQGAVVSRKVGKDSKEIINVNPAYSGEKELDNEYNIRSSTDVVSGLKGITDYINPSKNTTTIESKEPYNVLAEHSADILNRLDKDKQIGAGKIILSNNIMKGGRRVANLNYTGEDINWYDGGIHPVSAHQNIGTNPYSVRGGLRECSDSDSDEDSESDEEMIGGDIWGDISKGAKSIGKSVSKGVSKATKSVGKVVSPVTKGLSKVEKSISKVTDKINPMSYALDNKTISKGMSSLGDVTHDYILPAVVQAGKPIYDATAMAASTALTGNPVLGKVAADTLWNEMVAKQGYDPRKNQKSEILGELATTAGKAAAAEAGGSRMMGGAKSRWVDWIRQWAKDHNTSYGCALTQPECREEYHRKYGTRKTQKEKAEQEAMESEEGTGAINKMSRHKDLVRQMKEKLNKNLAKKEQELMGAEDINRSKKPKKKVILIEEDEEEEDPVKRRGRPKKYETAEEARQMKIKKTIEATKRRREKKRNEKKAPAKMKGGVREILNTEVNRVRDVIDSLEGYFSTYMTPKQIKRAFSYICIDILPNTREGVIIDEDQVKKWVIRANTER